MAIDGFDFWSRVQCFGPAGRGLFQTKAREADLRRLLINEQSSHLSG